MAVDGPLEAQSSGQRAKDQLEDRNVVGEMTLWGIREQHGQEQGQRKLEDCGEGLLSVVQGHSLE